MPTPKKGPRLGGSPAHERLILGNLATALFEHGQITTTQAKAKRLQPLAESLITKAKRGDLAARRNVMKTIRDKGVVHVLFTEIGEKFADRPGGYTRITKLGPRKGDNAPMVVIQLVEESLEDGKKAKKAAAKKTTAKKAASDDKPAKKATAKKAAAADIEADDASEKYGKDAASPAADGSGPDGFEIKGNEDSMKYHAPDSPWYEKTKAEVWFRTEEAAQKAGFEKAGGDADGADTAAAAKVVDVPEGEYGAGSAAPTEDGSAPSGFDIKGNKDSMKYHTPESPWYDQTEAEVWFNSEDAAQKAGFEKAGK